jgi:hypothetical protein
VNGCHDRHARLVRTRRFAVRSTRHRLRSPGSSAALTAIRAVHTLTWFSIESCVVYVLYAGFTKRSDRRTAIAVGVVLGETLIFSANGFRCPLTQLAQRLGAERGSVTDIYLPRWFAHNLPAIHVPLIALAIHLHARNLRIPAEGSHDTALLPYRTLRRRDGSASAPHEAATRLSNNDAGHRSCGAGKARAIGQRSNPSPTAMPR